MKVSRLIKHCNSMSVMHTEKVVGGGGGGRRGENWEFPKCNGEGQSVYNVLTSQKSRGGGQEVI